MKLRRFGLIKNFSIVARLRVSATMAMVAVLVTCATGYIGLTRSNADIEQSSFVTRAVLNQKQADMMHDALRADVLYALQIGPDGSADDRRSVLDDLTAHMDEFERSIAALDGLPLDPEIKRDVDAVRPLMKDYLLAAKEAADSAFSDATRSREVFAGFMEKFSALEDAMGKLGDAIAAKGDVQGKETQANNLFLITVVLSAGAAAALILIVSNVLIGRSITGPLSRVKTAIKEVASGNLGGRYSAFDRVSDLNDDVSEIGEYMELLRIRLREALEMEQQIRVTQKSQQDVVLALGVGLENLSRGTLTESLTEPFAADYEELRTNFNRTVERLNETIAQVVEVSRGIRVSADEIHESSEDLSRRTENQAATLEETAAALDQLTASVTAAASVAREVEAVVQDARSEAQASGKVVMSAVEAMNGIEKSARQISQIIGVIDDIAFQTNLLALNAGVEAARAGDAGRGFAVVASEVRALAQRSSTASNEIKQLISTSSQLVDRGVASVSSAGKALNRLIERVSEISSLVSGIATGAAEQATGLSEVNVGVTQLDQVAQRNAAMVQASMTTSQSLQQDAVGLEDLVAQFTTQSPVTSAKLNTGDHWRASF